MVDTLKYDTKHNNSDDKQDNFREDRNPAL